MKRLTLSLLVALGLLVTLSIGARQLPSVAAATADATPSRLGTPLPPQTVKIAASDGLQIVGVYYSSMLSGSQAPAALLLHEYGMNKTEFDGFIPALLNDGYSVLAVDLRGFGDTGGKQDMKLAKDDVSTILSWMRNQPSIDQDRIALIGSSIGADLALYGCVTNKQCRVAVALSPSDAGPTMTDAVKKLESKKAILLAVGLFDNDSVPGVMKLAAMPWGNVLLRISNGSTHGSNLLYAIEDLWPTVLQWLRTYNVKVHG